MGRMAGALIRASFPKGMVDLPGLAFSSATILTISMLPLVVLRQNRIAPGRPVMLWEALPSFGVAALSAFVVILAFGISHPRSRLVRTVLGFMSLLVLMLAAAATPGYILASAADHDAGVQGGQTLLRVSLGSGFWVLWGIWSLIIVDALARTQPSVRTRLLLLVAVLAALAAFMLSGAWDELSLMKEYIGRRDSFWQEATRHVALSFGASAAAICLGGPMGVICHRITMLRTIMISALNMIQAIPSIALFGMLMVPLAALSAHVPLAHAIGIRGIGAAPAFFALLLYSLLPVVVNVVAGLSAVPVAVTTAARAMGMTGFQRFWQVELPLALPMILAAVRIALVQNIGLTTIAALIGGGGFGVFVFQGIGQMATDLILLGVIPTVLLAFTAAIVLDAAIERCGLWPSEAE